MKVHLKFMIDPDEVCNDHYLIVINDSKHAITFLPRQSKLKLFSHANQFSKLARKKHFSALARELGLTKKQLVSLMGYASSFKHWEQEKEIEEELE